MSIPTDHQTSHPQTPAFEGQLVCPYCQHSFPLTWRRYWSAPLGGHQCPQCSRVSYLKDNSFWVWPIRMAGIMIGGIALFALAVYIFNNLWIGTLFALIGGLGIGFPTDKWIDGHLRRLRIRS